MENYCIYLRKSRSDIEAEEYGEGETLARHEKILLSLAKKQKLTITYIYKEIVSGENISSRPEMQKLLNDVDQNKWSGVLVMEIERLARGDTMDQGIVAQSFKYSNTKIITPNKVYDPNNEFDEEYFEFGLFMSRREYKTINRRLQRGRIESVKEGKYVASVAPYGYKRKKLEGQKGYTLEPETEQAQIIKLIFDLFTKGEAETKERLGVAKIVRYLNNLNIPPKKGDVWVNSTVKDILSNPVYAGKIRWNYRKTVKFIQNSTAQKTRPRSKEDEYILTNALHKPLIDEETFSTAQEYLTNSKTVSVQKNNTIKNPLAGLVKCGKCGRSMVRRPYQNNQPDMLMCHVTSCSNISAPLYLVEKKIIDALEQWLYEYKINWNSDNNKSLINSVDIKLKSIKKLESEEKKLKTQIDNLHNLLEQGIYSIDKFLERSQILSEQSDYIKLKITCLENEIIQAKKIEKNKKETIPKIEKILKTYYNLKSPKNKNELLKEVLEKIEYYKDKNGRWHNSPEDFIVVLYPKVQK